MTPHDAFDDESESPDGDDSDGEVFEPSSFDQLLDRLTECARSGLVAAARVAGECGHASIQTGHLLIGLAAGEGAAARLLHDCGGHPERYLADLRFIAGIRADEAARNGSVGAARAPRLDRVLIRAEKDATKRGSPQIGTLHLLAGLAKEREGLAAALLDAPGGGLERIDGALVIAFRAGWTEE